MKHRTSRVLLSCLLLSAALPVPVVYAQVSPLSSAVGAPLREIQVVGAQRVEPATIASYMDIRKGDPLNDESIDRAVKSLYATGLFADVSMSQKGDVLMVRVVENPLINEIAFEGNDRISDETLLAEIQLRPRQVFTRSKVQEDSSRLYDVYQRSGRFAARIEPKIIQLDQNRINLVFEVDEGNKTKVKAVRFVGNDKFSDDRLRDVISTSESRWYNFLSSNDQYDEDRISYDQEQLRTFYLSRGYADFQVISAEAEMSPDRESFYVTFTVDEGKRYRVGKVGVRAALKDANTRALEKTATFEQGDWYNAEELDKTIDAMTKELGNQLVYNFEKRQLNTFRTLSAVDLSKLSPLEKAFQQLSHQLGKLDPESAGQVRQTLLQSRRATPSPTYLEGLDAMADSILGGNTSDLSDWLEQVRPSSPISVLALCHDLADHPTLQLANPELIIAAKAAIAAHNQAVFAQRNQDCDGLSVMLPIEQSTEMSKLPLAFEQATDWHTAVNHLIPPGSPANLPKTWLEEELERS